MLSCIIILSLVLLVNDYRLFVLVQCGPDNHAVCCWSESGITVDSNRQGLAFLFVPFPC